MKISTVKQFIGNKTKSFSFTAKPFVAVVFLVAYFCGVDSILAQAHVNALIRQQQAQINRWQTNANRAHQAYAREYRSRLPRPVPRPPAPRPPVLAAPQYPPAPAPPQLPRFDSEEWRIKIAEKCLEEERLKEKRLRLELETAQLKAKNARVEVPMIKPERLVITRPVEPEGLRRVSQTSSVHNPTWQEKELLKKQLKEEQLRNERLAKEREQAKQDEARSKKQVEDMRRKIDQYVPKSPDMTPAYSLWEEWDRLKTETNATTKTKEYERREDERVIEKQEQKRKSGNGYRTWNSASGTYKTYAMLVAVSEDGQTVTLRKTDGKELDVPLKKILEEDQEFVRTQQTKF